MCVGDRVSLGVRGGTWAGKNRPPVPPKLLGDYLAELDRRQ